MLTDLLDHVGLPHSCSINRKYLFMSLVTFEQSLTGITTTNFQFSGKPLTLSQTTNFRLSKVKEFADDNFKCDENGRMFSKWAENTVENGEIARHEQFLLFPQCFQKTYTADR